MTTDATIAAALDETARVVRESPTYRLVAENSRLREALATLQRAIQWALGAEPAPDGTWFGEQKEGDPPYWWRKKLQAIASSTLASFPISEAAAKVVETAVAYKRRVEDEGHFFGEGGTMSLPTASREHGALIAAVVRLEALAEGGEESPNV